MRTRVRAEPTTSDHGRGKKRCFYLLGRAAD